LQFGGVLRGRFGRWDIDRQKKRPDSFESGLLPLNVTGGSVAPLVPWELAEGGSAGRGKSI
jgi:hypothetical protein